MHFLLNYLHGSACTPGFVDWKRALAIPVLPPLPPLDCFLAGDRVPVMGPLTH